eukprot:scaffold237612_cov22-Tisochrysis_lutea.AAC.2
MGSRVLRSYLWGPSAASWARVGRSRTPPMSLGPLGWHMRRRRWAKALSRYGLVAPFSLGLDCPCEWASCQERS